MFFSCRYLYWLDQGQFPKIERSHLDGSNRTVLVKHGIIYPRGITIDITTHEVYWVDSRVDAIQVWVLYLYLLIECMSSWNTYIHVFTYLTSNYMWVSVSEFCFNLFFFCLQKMSFSGGNRKYVKSNLPSPFGIAIKDDYMYWVDRNLKKVGILMYFQVITNYFWHGSSSNAIYENIDQFNN